MKICRRSRLILRLTFLLFIAWRCVSAANAATCQIAPTGLAAFWPGDGNAVDLVDGHNGILRSNANATAVGKVGSAFSFDGTNSYVEIPDSPTFHPTNFTIEAWVWFDGLFSAGTGDPGEQYIIFKQNKRSGSFEAFALQKVINASSQHVFHFVVIGAGGPPSAKVDSTSVVSTGAWYHVAGVRGSNYLQLYVNGVLEAQTSVTFSQDYGTLPLYFGSTRQSYDGKLKGKLDEVSLYNRPLSSNEIATIYAAGSAGKCRQLQSYTPFAFTEPATSITSWGATLNGMATPNGLPSAAWFEWGKNGDFGQTTAPQPVGAGSNVVWVSADVAGLFGGHVYNCRLVVSNAAGVARGPARQLILGGRVTAWAGTSASATNVPAGLTTATAIAAGGNNNLALKTDSTLVSWGNIATTPAGLANVIGMSVGTSHCLALKGDGKVVAWGDGSFGAGFGQTNVPPGLSNVVSVVAGIYNSLALKRDGTVVGWGLDGATNIPPGLSNVVMLAAGNGYQSLALRNDGTIVCWGTSNDSLTNAPAGLADVVDLAKGVYANLALKGNGSLTAWGPSPAGQTNIPSGLSNVVAIAAGYYHELALKPDGRVVGLGRNDVGQTDIPSNLTNVVTVAAGGSHNLALRTPLVPPPLNDNFANAFALAGTSTTAIGSNGNATKEPGEPFHAGDSGGASVWWKWTAPSHGVVTIDASGSSFTTLVGLYIGESVSSLTAAHADFGRIRNVPVTAGTTYFIAVDGYSGARGSISLSLIEVQQPANDTFANRIEILDDNAILSGSNVGAGVEQPEEQIPTFNNSLATVWWTWTAPGNGRISIRQSGTSIYPVLAIYTGSSLAGLSLRRSREGAIEEFDVIGGTAYQIQVDGYLGTVGNITLDFKYCQRPRLLGITATQSTQPDGIHVLFCADVSGTPPFNYNWSVQTGSAIPIGSSSDSCFEVVLSPTDETDVSVSVTVSGCGGTGTDTSGTVPACGICLTRGAPSLLTGATGSGGGPQRTTSCGTLSSDARWYKMIATNDTGLVTVSTEGSTNNTLLAIFTGSLASLTTVACNENVNSSNLQSRVTFNAVQGNVYWIAVDPRGPNTSTLRLASGFQPRIATYASNPDGSFQLQSSLAPAIPYRLLMSSNLSMNSNNWTVVLSTNLTTTFPYLYYRETNAKSFPRRFYRLAPEP